MANNPGARKAIRKIEARTQVNKARRSRVRTYLRKFQEAVTGGDADTAKAAFIEAQSELMRAVSMAWSTRTPARARSRAWPRS